MKKVIIASCIVLAVTLLNYPIFDSEGISYLIVFACLVAISFSGAKIYNPTDKEDYDSIDKEISKLQKYEGYFKYTHEGFYNKQNNSPELIKWDEIVSVYSFSIPGLYHSQQTGIEIITDKNSYEFDSETPGIEKLTNELYDHLPDWNLGAPTIKINNHGLEKTKLYERKDF